MGVINSSNTFKRKTHPCINDIFQNNVNELRTEIGGFILSEQVKKILCSIDRGDYAKLNHGDDPYGLNSVYIGSGATLSKLLVHAWALEQAYQKFKDLKKINILDIGSGSGYL